jgi:hypothetical protein
VTTHLKKVQNGTKTNGNEVEQLDSTPYQLNNKITTTNSWFAIYIAPIKNLTIKTGETLQRTLESLDVATEGVRKYGKKK